jgi:hypothetical protein
MGEGKDKSPGRRWVSEKVELARVGKADSASSTLHPHVVQSLSLVQRELQQSYEGYRHRRIRAHCLPLSGVAQELLLMPSSETVAVLCDFFSASISLPDPTQTLPGTELSDLFSAGGKLNSESVSVCCTGLATAYPTEKNGA